jgi:DNA-binding transcriptional MerR regulator
MTANQQANLTGGLKSIGEVIELLRNEFQDISISKIRFLESNGLLTPQRTASGYRKFTVVDIEQLKYILRMQRDYFLPLKVIREHIDAINRGLEPPVVGDVAPKPPALLMDVDSIVSTSTGMRLTKEELVGNSGGSADFVDALIEYGIIKVTTSGYFTGLDLNIAQKCFELSQFGLEPRHLKTVATSASREVELFTPILKNARSGKNPVSKAQAEDLALALAGSIVSLHAYLVRDLLDLEK